MIRNRIYIHFHLLNNILNALSAWKYTRKDSLLHSQDLIVIMSVFEEFN